MGLVAAFSNLLPSVLLVLSVTVKSLAHCVQSSVVLNSFLTPYSLPLGGFTTKSNAHRLSAVALSTRGTMACDLMNERPSDTAKPYPGPRLSSPKRLSLIHI